MNKDDENGNTTDFKGIDWGNAPIDLKLDKTKTSEFIPIELHLKKDGAVGNKPSLCIVMRDSLLNHYVYGQVDLEMWNKAFNQIGYQIVKK